MMLRFRWFTSYWTYRNDMDTVGVRPGCKLLLFTDSDFTGHKVSIYLQTIYIHTIYTISTHYLLIIYTISTQYLHTIYTLSTLYLHTNY